jgi:hypothetical protein
MPNRARHLRYDDRAPGLGSPMTPVCCNPREHFLASSRGVSDAPFWPRFIGQARKSKPVRLANEPAAASGESDALLYSPMDEEWGHFFVSSFFIASWDIASSFFMAS